MKLTWLITFVASFASIALVCPTEGAHAPGIGRLRKVKGESGTSHRHDGRRKLDEDTIDTDNIFEAGGGNQAKKGKKAKKCKKKKNNNNVCEESEDCFETTNINDLYEFCDAFEDQEDKCCTNAMGAVGSGGCSNLAGTFEICRGSCKGDDACLNTGQVSTKIGIGSCIGDYSCEDLGALSSSLTVADGSCSYETSCSGLGATTPGVVSIGALSCTALASCENLGAATLDTAAAIDVAVGVGSCNKEEACTEVGSATTNTVLVGNNACTTVTGVCKSCKNMDATNPVSIGDSVQACPA